MDLEISRQWVDLPWFLRSMAFSAWGLGFGFGFFLLVCFVLFFNLEVASSQLWPWHPLHQFTPKNHQLLAICLYSEKRKGSQYHFHCNEQKHKNKEYSWYQGGWADSSSPLALLTANIFVKHKLYYSLQKTLGKFSPGSAVALVASVSSETSRNWMTVESSSGLQSQEDPVLRLEWF